MFGSLLVKSEWQGGVSRVCARFVPPCGERRDNYTIRVLGANLRANKASLKERMIG